MSSFIVDAANRRELVNSIDMGLIASGTRVTRGAYEVTIRRLSKKEIDEMTRKETESKKCASWGHVRDAKGVCSRCGEQT